MESNPFGQDHENPFADPSVADMTSRASQGVGDFNPFAEQDQSSKSGLATTPAASSAPPPPVPAPIPQSQPAVLQTRQEPPPYVVEEEQENLRKRQEDLEKKAAELQRKEQELQRLQYSTGYRENNFPPLPKWCKCRPCFYHDIQVDIPVEYQKTCKFLFLRWQAYSFAIFFNFLSAFGFLVMDIEPVHSGETFGLSILFVLANIPLSFLCWYRPAYKALNFMMFFNFIVALGLLVTAAAGNIHEGATFGLSILYLIFNIPASFLCWYRPAYKALKNDSSFSYVSFFLIFFLHIGINIYYCLGVPGGGACGFINATQAIHGNKAIGIMMFVCGGMFLAGVIIDILLIIRVHRIYRMAGASLQKAQGEFSKGVATNPHVQNAAAAGVRAAMDNQK